MFNPVEPNANFPRQELAIGQFWKENRIYEKSLEQRAPTACRTPATA